MAPARLAELGVMPPAMVMRGGMGPPGRKPPRPRTWAAAAPAPMPVRRMAHAAAVPQRARWRCQFWRRCLIIGASVGIEAAEGVEDGEDEEGEDDDGEEGDHRGSPRRRTARVRMARRVSGDMGA